MMSKHSSRTAIGCEVSTQRSRKRRMGEGIKLLHLIQDVYLDKQITVA